MRKVCVIGHFGFGKELLNGQTIKTKNVTRALVEEYGDADVGTIDTHGGIFRLPIVVLKTIVASFRYKNIIMLPAHNGIKVFAPLLALLSMITNCKMHYVVIGGWLYNFLRDHKWLIHYISTFSMVYVETSFMRNELASLGITKISILPNFKYLKVLKREELEYSDSEPLKLCIFSRIMKEKGIEDAIRAVSQVNNHLKKTVYKLDIYGQVDNNYEKRFNRLQEGFPDYIRYCGSVESDKSIEFLNGYFCLLFPTMFYTEGIPGTIIDAYSAGVPVIASRWVNCSEIIDDYKTGVCYDFGQYDQLVGVLTKIVSEKYLILKMKKNCLIKANDYSPNSIKNIFKRTLD